MTCPYCQAENDASATRCVQCDSSLRRAPEILPGFVLASRYEIRKALGRGGMGMVYLAHDRLLNETIAIKVLKPEVAESSAAAQRFLSEIKLARRVSHRNVARIHEYGEDQGLRYISMTYVDGMELKKLIKERGPLPPAEGYDIAIAVSDALQAIHDEGIVHRDLKTSNIMVDGRGVPRLMDFGIAKQWSADTDGLTGAGQIVGTPEYMSPEQVRGNRVDARSDLYAMGIVMYEMFTGQVPFHADTPLSTVMMHLTEPPVFDSSDASRIPRPLVPVLQKALAKERDERFASARELARALERARDSPGTATTFVPRQEETLAGTEEMPTPVPWGHPPSAPPAAATGVITQPAPTRVLPPRRRRTTQWIAAAAGAAVIAALAVAVWFAASRANAPSTRPPVAAAPDTAVRSPFPPAPIPSATATEAAADMVARNEGVGQATSSPVRTATVPSPAATGRPAAPLDPARHDVPHPPEQTAAAEQPRAPEAGGLLVEAETALTTQDYDRAIALYDQALKAEPRNQAAVMGRATALNAKVTAQVLAGGARAAQTGRAFVAGATRTESVERKEDKKFAEGFEAAPGIEVTRDTQAASMPARIDFQVRPERAGPGDRYDLSAFLFNAGTQPIEIYDMVVTTTVNGRKAAGPVAPRTKLLAPGQRGLLLQVSDALPQELSSWSVEVFVRTKRGEGYRSQLTLK